MKLYKRAEPCIQAAKITQWTLIKYAIQATRRALEGIKRNQLGDLNLFTDRDNQVGVSFVLMELH
jgi:hypothetical protein